MSQRKKKEPALQPNADACQERTSAGVDSLDDACTSASTDGMVIARDQLIAAKLSEYGLLSLEAKTALALHLDYRQRIWGRAIPKLHKRERKALESAIRPLQPEQARSIKKKIKITKEEEEEQKAKRQCLETESPPSSHLKRDPRSHKERAPEPRPKNLPVPSFAQATACTRCSPPPTTVLRPSSAETRLASAETHSTPRSALPVPSPSQPTAICPASADTRSASPASPPPTTTPRLALTEPCLASSSPHSASAGPHSGSAAPTTTQHVPSATPSDRSANTAERATPTLRDAAPRFSSLVVESLHDWTYHFKTLKKMLGHAPHSHPYGRGIRFTPKDEEEFRLVRTYLSNLESKHSIKWYTYGLPAEKYLKIAISGLPADTSTREIVDELRRLGYEPKTVHPVTGRGGRPSSVFFAIMEHTENLTPGIYAVNELLCMPSVKIEPWREPSYNRFKNFHYSYRN